MQWKKCYKKPTIVEYCEVKKGDRFETRNSIIVVPDDKMVLIKDMYGERILYKNLFLVNYETIDGEENGD